LSGYTNPSEAAFFLLRVDAAHAEQEGEDQHHLLPARLVLVFSPHNGITPLRAH
jgi:hypothetical protein